MSWFVVGGIAIGATAGAIAGSKKGGDDVWKGALIGGAVGGVGGWAAAPAAAGAAPAAGAALAPEAAGSVGILGAEGAAAGSGLALGGAGLETGGAMAGGASGAGIVGAEGAATGAGAGGMGLGQAGGFGSGATFGGSGTSFGAYGGATVPEGGGLLNAGFAPGMQAPVQMVSAPELATVEASPAGDIVNGVQTGVNKTGYTPPPQQSPLEKGFGSAMSWLSEPKNAMLTGVLGLGALSMFNNNNENNFGGSTVTPAGYPLSPNFKPSRYQPTRTYVGGGEIYGDYDGVEDERFKTGGSASDNSDKAFAEARRYQGMLDPRMNVQTPDTPDWVRSRGVYHDEDPDTKYQDALTAAQTRMGKAASRANVQLAAMQKPKPLGGINLGPVAGREEEERKATGGITSLGGYAHGGNARLLRGPGDGMSDDIPATIADKQPARLADGEFVVPADVVSGLGNGSTEAGAKKLHQMMDKVRVDRTGTKKQGKQIKAEKYVPGLAKGGIASYANGNLVVNPDTNEVGYWTNQNEWGFGGDWNPITQEQYNQKQTSAPVSATANTTAQGYGTNDSVDYYNKKYWTDLLGTQQQRVNDLNSGLKPQQEAVDALNKQGAQIGARLGGENETITGTPGQQVAYGANGQYAYGTIGPDGRLNLSNSVFGDPIVGTVKSGYAYNPQGYTQAQYDAATASLAETKNLIDLANQDLAKTQPNVDRLSNTSVAYNPYTIANRPSAAEPQFYGNIYKPEYVNYEQPGYSLSGGLGQWSNVAGDTQRYVEGLYNTELGRGSDPEGMRFWNARLQSGALDPAQVRQGFWGSDEYRGLHPSIEMPTQMQPNVNQIANEQRLAQAEQLSNSQTAALNSRNLINASVAAGKNQPAQEKKARQGGILAVKR